MEASNYGTYWDQFYRQNYLEKKGGKALWDVPVAHSIALDYPRFGSAFGGHLPILDIGCGTGEIACFLADRGHQVIGADVAREAIEIASSQHHDSGILFRVLDITDTVGCQQIAVEYGPVNVYIRGVMHQIAMDDLPRYVNNIAILLNGEGYFYMIEVASGIRDHFLHHAEHFHKLPRAVQQIFISNLPPRGICVEDVARYFRSDLFEILFCDNTRLETNLRTPDGTVIQIPAVHALIRTHNIS